MKSIYLAGSPSTLGGADTEALNNIYLWRRYGVDVHIVPMGGIDSKMALEMQSIGCTIHEYEPSIFKDKIVVSYCNGNFLAALPKIMEEGKPALVVWANCMTYVFSDEIIAHKNKWIDIFVFVSNYQENMLRPQLEVHNPVKSLVGYKPYFNLDKVSFTYREPQEWHSFGRVSRDDGSKFPTDLWETFYKICVPKRKKIFVLGFGPNAVKKTGPAPSTLDWQTWLPNEIPVKSFYQILHCIVHKTGGSRESYCRICPEAYAYGVPFICEDDFAFPELVIDGVTGYRCKSSDEMSYRASELAFDEIKRKNMIIAARKYLENDIAAPEQCWSAWKQLF